MYVRDILLGAMCLAWYCAPCTWHTVMKNTSILENFQVLKKQINGLSFKQICLFWLLLLQSDTVTLVCGANLWSSILFSHKAHTVAGKFDTKCQKILILCICFITAWEKCNYLKVECTRRWWTELCPKEGDIGRGCCVWQCEWSQWVLHVLCSDISGQVTNQETKDDKDDRDDHLKDHHRPKPKGVEQPLEKDGTELLQPQEHTRIHYMAKDQHQRKFKTEKRTVKSDPPPNNTCSNNCFTWRTFSCANNMLQQWL